MDGYEEIGNEELERGPLYSRGKKQRWIQRRRRRRNLAAKKGVVAKTTLAITGRHS